MSDLITVFQTNFIAEAHRALEQLEEYHASLVSASSVELKREIEKLINNFKGALFQSLIGTFHVLIVIYS